MTAFVPPPSLSGCRIAIPTSDALSALQRVLEDLAAEVRTYRVSDPRSDVRSIEKWLAELISGEFDDVLFSTAQGVRLVTEFASALGKSADLIAALKGTRVICRGRRPARALEELGVDVAARSPGHSIEDLLVTLGRLDFSGSVVGVQRSGPQGDERLVEYFERSGAWVRQVSNAPVNDDLADQLVDFLAGSVAPGIIFTDVSQVTWLFDAAVAGGRESLLRATLARSSVVATEAASSDLRSRRVRAQAVSTRSLTSAPRGPEVAALFRPPPSTEGASPQTSQARRRDSSFSQKKTIVVVGNGMVGYKFCEKLAQYDTGGRYRVITFCEEPRPAYDRVHLTSYFESRDASQLLMATEAWYAERGIELLMGRRATSVDTARKVVVSSDGTEIEYDHVVLATGSEPFVPPVPGMDKPGVFVYRTIEDLEAIIAYSKNVRRAAVIGGGLLGLEAAKAVYDLGLETHVVEFAPRLMPRQLDSAGASLLAQTIRGMGVQVHLDRNTSRVTGDGHVDGLRFSDGERLDVGMVVVSAGIRPRDELARQCGIAVGERGGIIVDDGLATSDPSVFAIGECALHRQMIYGLIGPGNDMADVLARRLCGMEGSFEGADTSTKLKLLGIDVASFGEPLDADARTRSIVYEDTVKGVYKKLVLSENGSSILGGILVGDAAEYGTLTAVMRSGQKLPEHPESLILGARGGEEFGIELGDEAQICSCNNVSKGDICRAVAEGATSAVDIKRCTTAGAGCGGCVPLVTDIVTKALAAAGVSVKPRLCEHFDHTRQELYDIVRVKGLRTFEQVLAEVGEGGEGCEICKPTLASIFASVFNEHIVDHDYLQDTNDRFLANIQRTGLYSVVPRVPGGEITPKKLMALASVAEKYGLYTKITGGQRIDLFGARVGDLPNIWEELVAAGFESGHAYGKALRTVKSCVGSTWCRYGVQDSVGFAIRVEQRYKGIRAPHKLKSAVSGCVRECAEAQSKDFGIIATEKGWNIYVCGNGGAKPRHADLLVTDVDEATAIKIIDRFLMFYIKTADKLTRTSVWLEKLDGGIDYLRQVVVEDSLGLCEQLDREMQFLVDTYRCEWAEVVKSPVKRRRFEHFVNSPEPDPSIELIEERGQRRPQDWDKSESTKEPRRLPVLTTSWVNVGRVEDFPANAGRTILHGDAQIAVFNFTSQGRWYATQNVCPHRGDQVLSRGIIGDARGVPKVACPLHKKTFSLDEGKCLSGEDYEITTFPVKIQDGAVFVDLPSPADVSRIVPPARRRPSQAGTVATA